jgi:hypothetical protein
MPLPRAAAHRQLKRRRSIDVQVFSRGDGLWEVDALLQIDRCPGLRSDDRGVRTYSPRWFRQPGVNNAPDNSRAQTTSEASRA